VVVARAEGVLIEMLYSEDPRRRERAADKILSSWAARDHPLFSGENLKARRGRNSGQHALIKQAPPFGGVSRSSLATSPT
jgi:hypothetical protein